MTGKLITFEGPEGGGKSTHARRLAEELRARGISVLTTREPGGTPTGEIIRDLLQNDLAKEPLCDAAEALLFCASRAQLCRNVLGPALARGEWIVLDRFTDSTLAYQGYGRGFDVDIRDGRGPPRAHAPAGPARRGGPRPRARALGREGPHRERPHRLPPPAPRGLPRAGAPGAGALRRDRRHRARRRRLRRGPPRRRGATRPAAGRQRVARAPARRRLPPR